jgi:GNAT superfamily N-acetyltransferase
MRSKALWGYDEAFMEACRAELTVRKEVIGAGEVWVAEDGGVPIGLLSVARHGNDAEVRMMFVAPEHVGRGIGTALWSHLEAQSLALGVSGIVLDADPNAEPFYARMGMRVVGRSPSGSIPGRTLPRMAKRLSVQVTGSADLRREQNRPG